MILTQLRPSWTQCATRFFAAFCLTLLATGAYAQVTASPSLVNFQGRLTKPDGTPAADGTVSIRFSLWTAATGGSEKWNQTVNPVAVKNGTFAVLLNLTSGFTAGNDLRTTLNGNTYLEIKVGTDAALTPRQQLVSMAYALRANGVADGSITSDSIANGAITSDKLASNALGWLLAGNNVTNPATQFLGTTSNQPLVFRTNNAERMRLLADGNLGIGTTTPGFPLNFGNVIGDKISLWGQSGPHYGFGIQGGLLQIHTDVVGSDVAFGYGTSGAMTETMRIKGNGNVGIGTNSPGAKLQVNGGASNVAFFAGNRSPFGTAAFETDFNTPFPSSHLWFAEGGNRVFSVGAGGQTVITSTGNLQSHLDMNSNSNIGTWIWLRNSTTGGGSWAIWTSGSANGEGAGKLFMGHIAQLANGNVGVGTATPTSRLHVNGTTTTNVLTITGGSDIAEPFDVASEQAVQPGMVVTIDEKQVGKLRLATSAYDHAVAGIISGANGVKPGVTLTQEGTVADGKFPVAMSGRVWCYVDADANGSVVAGDLLTTSATPGYAMKATDTSKSHGAILGKAMSSLPKGKGLVLVLVNLH